MARVGSTVSAAAVGVAILKAERVLAASAEGLIDAAVDLSVVNATDDDADQCADESEAQHAQKLFVLQ